MNVPLAQAIAKYHESDIDFQQLLTWHLAHGIVVSCSEYFAMGYRCESGDLRTAVGSDRGNTLFVTFCSGNMAAALLPFVCDFREIAFERHFNGRCWPSRYDMLEFYKKLTR